MFQKHYNYSLFVRQLLWEQILQNLIGADSKKDFINKLNLTFKELYETQYWAKIFINLRNSQKLLAFLDETDQLLRILGTILRKLRTKR
jgi:four helix bundle protein